MRGAAVLAAVAAITAAGVAYVHWAQTAEREGMHAGVLRDEARLTRLVVGQHVATGRHVYERLTPSGYQRMTEMRYTR